jgi:hypothetical protein
MVTLVAPFKGLGLRESNAFNPRQNPISPPGEGWPMNTDGLVPLLTLPGFFLSSS